MGCRQIVGSALVCFVALSVVAAEKKKPRPANRRPTRQETTPAGSGTSEDFHRFGIYAKTAPRPAATKPLATTLPLELQQGDRIALIGNTLLERSQEFGNFEAMLQQRFPQHALAVRHLAWSADAIDAQPRPANFADTEQHLAHEQADVILAAFGFNESFAGEPGLADFRSKLTDYVVQLKSKAFNGKTAARIVLISPIANENVTGVAAADRNNAQIKQYGDVMKAVAAEQQVGFADVFAETEDALRSPGSELTVNGIHLTEAGDHVFSTTLFRKLFGEAPPDVTSPLRAAIVDKNRQFFRRFRPVNTFYYTGGRNRNYGYLDFLPAMRNFDLMVANRDRHIWAIAQGKSVPEEVDDSNVPPLPKAKHGRGANNWMTAADERKAFRVDPRFEVDLFAGEEQFPDIANPIQMRWDARGRLWVSCSTTYPHVYPGNEPDDKIVILEDTDGDGRADKSTVFADDLQIPLSFVFGDGGVYVSEQPQLTFLQDTNGDDKADIHRVVLSGFGTEDSHHSLHDFTWTPDGDLMFRESVFHHSQVETPYGPVRQQNSGWFRYQPRTHRLISFGTYSSTNPWGVTFDDWGQHMASHPVYAAAFHALDPDYPRQHPGPKGLQAYSGVCGQQFVDFTTFPESLQGHFIKVRYKPTNRVEIHQWIEGEFGYSEKYVGDLLFSSNLSFIPVDLQFGPRGALYVCDWYNPVKGHAQYSLRDERRDRHSGRIWRITTKGKPLQEPHKIAGASIDELLELLKRPEYRIRDWAKRELRTRDPSSVHAALDAWVQRLDAAEPRYRHHQLEAIWTYRWIGLVDLGRAATRQPGLETATRVLRELLVCDEHHARAAATQQLRYWNSELDDAVALLNASANDSNGIVRMQAAIAASYIGTKPAFEAILDVLKHPREGHLAYAITCALGSHTLRTVLVGKRPTRHCPHPETGCQGASDQGAESERLASSIRWAIRPAAGRYLLCPGTDAIHRQEVRSEAEPTGEDCLHESGRDRPQSRDRATGDACRRRHGGQRNGQGSTERQFRFHPEGEAILDPAQRPLDRAQSYFTDPRTAICSAETPGIYPYVCTFPGHWVVMNGVMVVAKDQAAADALLAASEPTIVKEWTMADFEDFGQLAREPDEATVVRGMTAFVKARCNQCHVVAGHGTNLGPDLAESVKQLKGAELLRQMIEPSSKIHEKFQSYQLFTEEGRVITGVIVKTNRKTYQVATNLLTPNLLTTVNKKDVEEMVASKISPMPTGMLNVLTKDEILDLHAFVESGGYQLPKHLKHHHQHGHTTE